MKGFAVTDNRTEKALKIDSVLADYLKVDRITGKKILDIGCGSGHISSYFSDKNDVTAADVVDQLSIENRKRVDFSPVTSEKLPFADNSYDIIISNHIAAYMTDHKLHFSEIQRVLKPGGVGYFATPNRYFPLEPHFKIPFLHYFPPPVFNFLMKLLGKFREPVTLIGWLKSVRLFKKVGLDAKDYAIDIIRFPARFHMKTRAFPRMPGLMTVLSPTMVFVLFKRK